MMLALSLLVLMAGYLLWVYASKQQKLHKTIGTVISWVVIVLSTIGMVCAVCKYIKYKGCDSRSYCPFSKQYGVHPKSEHSHKHHGEHSEEHHEGEPKSEK